ncbi:MAG: SPASM domain-containing protein [Bacilli bacterium]|nr:SPASM domain-containing protein [Bacilli bacterium]
MPLYSSKYNLYKKVDKRLFVFNTLTKGLIELEEDYFQKLKNNKIQELPSEIIEQLLNEKYLLKESYETDLLFVESEKKKYTSEILSLVIAPTMNCNFACPYCFEERKTSIMSNEVITLLIKFIENKIKTQKYKKLSIAWYGGEPLLGIKIIEEISKIVLDLCNKYNLEYYSNMITNGYLLSKKNINKLLELKVKTYQITIDGPPEIHNKRRVLKSNKGTFNVILNNIKNMIEIDSSINIMIRINIDKTNYKSLSKLIDILKQEKVRNISISLGHVQSFTEVCQSIENTCFNKNQYLDELFNFALLLKEKNYGEYISLLEIPERIVYCGAVLDNNFVFDPEGYAYKCWNEVGVKEKAFMNLMRPQTDKEIINETKYLKHNSLLDKKCYNCIGYPICMGGCPYNNIYSKESSCYDYEKEVEDYIKIMMGGGIF